MSDTRPSKEQVASDTALLFTVASCAVEIHSPMSWDEGDPRWRIKTDAGTYYGHTFRAALIDVWESEWRSRDLDGYPTEPSPFQAPAHEPCEQRVRFLDRRLAAVVTWVEANQPDAFRRGLWDAIRDDDLQPAQPPCALRDVAQAVVDWNTKYPSSRIYSEGKIRAIAKEMDAIFEQAKQALGITKE